MKKSVYNFLLPHPGKLFEVWPDSDTVLLADHTLYPIHHRQAANNEWRISNLEKSNVK